MPRSGFFYARRPGGPNNEEHHFNAYVNPYLDAHLAELCKAIQKRIETQLGVYYGIEDPVKIKEQLLKDIVAVVENHMTDVGQVRGAGLGSFFSKILQWLLPKAKKVISFIPTDVKEAAGRAAKEVMLTGISTVSSKIQDSMQNRGSGISPCTPLQACANAGICTLLHNDRGGFVGTLLTGLGALLPGIISLFQGSKQRGGRLGPYWKQHYPYPEESRGARAQPKRQRQANPQSPKPSTSKRSRTYVSHRGGAVSEPVLVPLYSAPYGTCVTECTLTISGGRRGGRPVKRTGYMDRSHLTYLN
uniref:LO6 n=1 Tax=Blueface angelfish adomavirus TaxID=2609871 RepID=A0A6F9EZC8_9VIRU|nr:TPA_asm: LO6 [Blueface angelfish adomavirus]